MNIDYGGPDLVPRRSSHSRINTLLFILLIIILNTYFQSKAANSVIEKFQDYAQEQKTKIEDLGATQQKRGKRKRRA